MVDTIGSRIKDDYLSSSNESKQASSQKAQVIVGVEQSQDVFSQDGLISEIGLSLRNGIESYASDIAP